MHDATGGFRLGDAWGLDARGLGALCSEPLPERCARGRARPREARARQKPDRAGRRERRGLKARAEGAGPRDLSWHIKGKRGMLKRTFSFEDLEPPQKRKIPMDEYNSDFRIVASFVFSTPPPPVKKMS